ncbi:response regulator [Caenispirillum salinarum]|uniref:response regulator n=1 Tax=Caenispirillum salinarum TaxID=859058 RepID=UPI00384F9B29
MSASVGDEGPFVVLLVEDNPADARLTQEAFADAGRSVSLEWVRDGDDAMAFLRRHPPYTEAPRPHLVLLDLNMPRKDGRATLTEIKGDAALKALPVVVLTTSESRMDVEESYRAHANAYVTKPLDMDELVAKIGALCDFWLNGVAAVPGKPAGR